MEWHDRCEPAASLHRFTRARPRGRGGVQRSHHDRRRVLGHGAAAGRHAAPPRATQLHSPLRARAGAVAAAARTRAHEHVNDIVVEEDEGRIVAFAAVCSPTIGGHPEQMEGPFHVYLEEPLGERKVIDALSGRELPYRNVLAELAEEYGLNGNGAGDDVDVDNAE